MYQSNKREAKHEIDSENPPPPAKRAPVEDASVDVVPPLNKVNLGEGALKYFNNLYFYNNNEAVRDAFLMVLKVTETPLVAWTLNQFFEEAWRHEETLVKDPESFLRDNFPLCQYAAILKTYKNWKKETNKCSKPEWVMNFERIVNVDFQIVESKLSHKYDLKCFTKRMVEVFEWHTNPKGVYAAPYFCFVQSSGMGKTKIMYEYKKQALEHNIICELLLPMDVETKDTSIFKRLDLVSSLRDYEEVKIDNAPKQETPQTEEPQTEEQLVQSRKEAEGIFFRLDKKLQKIAPTEKLSVEGKVQKVALLFDESHPLLKKEYGLEAFRFRCFRLWLREKRPNHQVVAVFAGTNSRFSNFLFETEEQLKNFVYPSRVGSMITRLYHPKAAKLYPPYFRTTTMGSCLPLLKEAEEKKGAALSEYEVAVYHGRPLFALMAKENKLDEKISEVLRRILLAHKDQEDDWDKFRVAWISLLSIRVQMGQTTAELASDLVAYSYAVFCGYSPESRAVRLGHFPDPVCARLAMCMMDDAYTHQVPSTKVVQGKDKKWWSKKLMDIFSTGIVSPEKGDFGEVVVALYMLFCGDQLRKRYNEEIKAIGKHSYRKFSVSLDAWLQIMLSGGQFPEGPVAECEVSVGFIQVCRNSLRSYEKSWKSLGNDTFLKNIFDAGIAFYVFPGCRTIDMVVPLRITNGVVTEYIPMFVSIKCRAHYSDQAMIKACKKMEQKAKRDKLRAVCLLISFASDGSKVDHNLDPEAFPEPVSRGTDISEYLLQQGQQIAHLVLAGGVVARGVRIPSGDEFGLTTAFQHMTPAAEIESELFSCHSYLKAYGDDANKDLHAETALRKGSYFKYENDYTSLKKAMEGEAE